MDRPSVPKQLGPFSSGACKDTICGPPNFPTNDQQPFGYLIGQISRKSLSFPFQGTNLTQVMKLIVLIAV